MPRLIIDQIYYLIKQRVITLLVRLRVCRCVYRCVGALLGVMVCWCVGLCVGLRVTLPK